MERKNILEEKSIISRPPIPETSRQFHLHFLKFLLLFSTNPMPVNRPKSHYRPVSISCYRHIPSRRDATAAVSCLLSCGQPILFLLHHLLFPPPSIVSVHYQHPGNGHEISQTRGKFSNEFCIRDFNRHRVSYGVQSV